MKIYSGNHTVNSNFFRFKLNLFLFFAILIFSINIYSQNLSAEKIYKKVSDAVVVVHAYDEKNRLSQQGSGVVINDKGYIVTNYHVLAGYDRLEILHNKKTVPYVDIIGIDVEKDILILKIEEKKFPSIKIGNSKNLSIGQRIYAIGSPLGLENTISEGIISGFRNFDESRRNFIQITASISSGSSGGAIVNDKGELIGISTFTIKEAQNLNFAIPINDILTIEIDSYSKNNTYKYFELFYRGNNADEKGEYQDAIKYYTSYIKIFPKDEHAYYNRGNSKSNLEDYRGAILDYAKTIELNPNHAGAFNNRGNCKKGLGDKKGAIQDYNKAIELDSKLVVAYTNRGRTKSDLGDNIGAIQDFTRAIEINPSDIYSYNNRGITYGKLNKHHEAIKDFDKAIELDPNFAEAYYNRGITKFNSGDKNGGCLDLSKAGELGENDAYVVIKNYCN